MLLSVAGYKPPEPLFFFDVLLNFG